MKKIFLAFTFIAGLSFLGFSQKTEKILKANKWYATGNFDGNNIILNKTAPAKSDWDAKFSDNGVMNYCSIVQSGLIDPKGVEVKAGTYYCDASYTYELNGDILHIKYPLVDWYYKVTKIANGNLELVYTTDENVIKGGSAK